MFLRLWLRLRIRRAVSHPADPAPPSPGHRLRTCSRRTIRPLSGADPGWLPPSREGHCRSPALLPPPAYRQRSLL